MTKPGAIAESAFDSGFWVATLAGMCAIVLLYSHGVLSVTNVTHHLYTLLFYPVYLLCVSVVLGMWLGYATDETDLERVRTELDEESTDTSEKLP